MNEFTATIERTAGRELGSTKWRRALCPGAWERWRTWHPDMIARIYKGGWWRLTMPGEGKGGCLHISEHRTLREAKARAQSGATPLSSGMALRQPVVVGRCRCGGQMLCKNTSHRNANVRCTRCGTTMYLDNWKRHYGDGRLTRNERSSPTPALSPEPSPRT